MGSDASDGSGGGGARREGGREARSRCGEGRLLDECGHGIAEEAGDGRRRVLELRHVELSGEFRRGQQGHVDAGAACFGLGIHDMRGRAAARTVIASAPRGTKIVKVENKAPQPRLVGAVLKAALAKEHCVNGGDPWQPECERREQQQAGMAGHAPQLSRWCRAPDSRCWQSRAARVLASGRKPDLRVAAQLSVRWLQPIDAALPPAPGRELATIVSWVGVVGCFPPPRGTGYGKHSQREGGPPTLLVHEPSS